METLVYRYPKERARLSAAVFFPNSYSIGMASLAVQSVYHILQSNPALNCERAFYKQGQSVTTVESGRGLSSFDIVFITISFEGDLPHIINGLRQSGIEPERARRSGGPLIVIGGIGTMIMPFYLGRIADLVISGDAGATLPPLVLHWLENGPRVEPPHIKGVYTGGSAQDLKTLTYIIDESPDRPLSHTVVLTNECEFPMRGLIEVSQSCQYNCAFCLVGNAYGPYRHFPEDTVIRTALRYKGKTDKLGLVAATLTNHPQFESIITGLNALGFQLSFSAFRVEGISDSLLSRILENENRTLVIAPETVSPHLRKAIRKHITPEAALSVIERASAMGIKRLKLYFLMGLPGETDADTDAIADFVHEARRITLQTAKNFGYIPELIVDVNPLVPKPLTEFEGAPMEDTQVIKKRLIRLKNRLRSAGRTFVTGESPRRARLQYEIAGGLLTWEKMLAMAD